MKNKIKYSIGVFLMACCITGGTAGATFHPVEQDKGNIRDTTVVGEIYQYEKDNMYILFTESGEKIRVDLGDRGGRLLWRTPFSVTGKYESDKNGNYLKADRIEYRDPDPFSDYEKARKVKEEVATEKISAVADRDPAYYHGSANSVLSKYYMKGDISNFHPEAYKAITAVELPNLDEGAKVTFTGRAVATLEKDHSMIFWDSTNKVIPVLMNNAYAPLGQRCMIYGTIVKSGETVYVSLTQLESVAERN